jgi:RHS repeat-associated protein
MNHIDFLLKIQFYSEWKVLYCTLAYEVNDHLGNVRASISDRRQFSSTIFDPVITDATDYFPFGAPNRTVSSSAGYRYGFIGHEKLESEFGTTDKYDQGARIYDSRIGRTFSLDPMKHYYPYASPYSYSLNSPIQAKDPDGKVII